MENSSKIYLLTSDNVYYQKLFVEGECNTGKEKTIDLKLLLIVLFLCREQF